MGSIFSAFTELFNVIVQVALSVWDVLLSFIDPFIQPWRTLFWFFFNVYVGLWTAIGSLTMKILVLPVRIYDAIQNEDALEIEMQRIRELYTQSKTRLVEAECELEQKSGECRQYKELLNNVEAEKRAILKKLQVLQLQVMELKEENDTIKAREENFLKGIHERTIHNVQKKMGNNRFEMVGYNNELDMECSNRKDLINMRPPHTSLKKMVTKTPSYLENQHKVGNGKIPLQLDNMHKCIPLATSHEGAFVYEKDRYQGWEAAVFSSMFSVFLTLLVGTIAWQAQDPCVPLVVAVFMVVCMSLKTVAQFLSSIYSGPGFDVVALLSFNWFILGMLAYPVLPRMVQFVAPYGSTFGHWFLRFMGVSYVTEQLKSAFL